MVNHVRISAETPWYDLFSRGARDWLRHDEKVRESVRKHLPQIVSGGDVINDTSRTVRVPVKMLEHYHFRLRRPEEQQGAGQGKAKPGDVFSDPSKQRGPGEKGPGGQDEGEKDIAAAAFLCFDDHEPLLAEVSGHGTNAAPEGFREPLEKRGQAPHAGLNLARVGAAISQDQSRPFRFFQTT